MTGRRLVVELLEPFLATGLVEEREGRLVVVDQAVLTAFGREEAPEQ